MSTMKRGGKPDKVNIKRILNEEKEALKGLKEKMELLSERLSLTLDSGGVPNVRASEVLKPLLLVHGNDDTSDNLREKLENSISSLIEATNAVEKVWSYCLCYPSLNVPNIADIIEELQSALCESASLANKPLQRKLVSLKSDPKADVVVLNELEGISKRVIGKCVTNASCSCFICFSV